MKRSIVAVLLITLCALFLAGCGGGGAKNSAPTLPAVSSSATGRAALLISWPARSASASRLIPEVSNSILVEVVRGGQVFDKQLIPRPADVSVPTQVLFDSVPVDALTLRATAYPNTDGTGVAQARGAVGVAITAGSTTSVNVVMDTTVDHIDITPAGPLSLTPGAMAALSATARDSAGAMVLLSPVKTSWTSSNPSAARVDAATGTVTAVNPGTTAITFSDSESGKSASVATTVAVPPLDFYTTQEHTRVISHFDSTGKLVDTFTIPLSFCYYVRGLGIGPNGLLYVVGTIDPFTQNGFVVLTVDVNKTIRTAFVYPGPNPSIGTNLSYGKMAFDRNNHVLVCVEGGVVQFPLGGASNSGTLLWRGDRVFGVAVQPSGNLFVMTNDAAWEMAGDGTNAHTIFSVTNGRSIGYDASTNTIYAASLGPVSPAGGTFDLLRAYDGTTYALKIATTFKYANDFCFTNDGKIVIGSFSQTTGIFDKALNPIGAFEGASPQFFVTQGTITGTNP